MGNRSAPLTPTNEVHSLCRAHGLRRTLIHTGARCKRERRSTHIGSSSPNAVRMFKPQFQTAARRAVRLVLSHRMLYFRPVFFRGQIIGKFKILSTIGSGGFGTVYLAEDTWIDKKVALKVPHKQGVDFGELLRDPRLLASLNHPNIVTILTAGKPENDVRIVI